MPGLVKLPLLKTVCWRVAKVSSALENTGTPFPGTEFSGGRDIPEVGNGSGSCPDILPS